MIVVDPRWSGSHGIARFAREVVSRLPWAVAVARLPASPTSPLDVVSPWRLPLRSTDVVYSPGFNAGVSRARQVVTLHDLIHLDEAAERSAAKTLYYDLVVKPVVERAGIVLTVSGTSKRRIQRWLGVQSHVDVVDIGNGCSDAFLEQPSTEPPAENRFLYVGNLKPHKNVDVIFGALARRPDHTLTLVTSDHDRAAALAERHGVRAQVRFLSGLRDDDLAALYRKHDAVLMPSKLEGFGLPALEALAAGRRVGYSSVCESVDEIVGTEGVAVAHEDDPEEWAQAMDSLLAAGASRIAAVAGWRDRYRWNRVAARVEAALAPLAPGPARLRVGGASG